APLDASAREAAPRSIPDASLGSDAGRDAAESDEPVSDGPDGGERKADAGIPSSAILYYGGQATPDPRSTWEWDGSQWSGQVAPGPGENAPFAGHQMASFGDKVLLFGGVSVTSPASAPSGETWQWDGWSWSRLASIGPGAREAHSLTTVAPNLVLL